MAAPKQMPNVPPVEVSRMALLALVALGVVLAIAAGPDLSHFGMGFAVGAGAALALSRLRRPPESQSGEEGLR